MNSPENEKRSRRMHWLMLLPLAIFCVISLSWCSSGDRDDARISHSPEPTPIQQQTQVPEQTPHIQESDPPEEPEPELEPEPEPEPEPPPLPWELFSPHSLPETDPFSESMNYSFSVQLGGEIVEDFINPETIFFGMPDTYALTESVTTMRGNNFRNNPSFGVAEITQEKLSQQYYLSTTSLNHWTGVGWSGQPAIVKWDYDLQQHMNMLPGKKEKEDLIEVIQGATDGYVYFFDLEDGERTRNPLRYGEPIKGGVSVDPRGYPILCIGQGDQFGYRTGFALYSLFDLSELYFLNGHDPFSPRYWGLFDSNPLFDTTNDRLFECGENGVIYNIKLNTVLDRAAGTISVSPEIARYRYTSNVNRNRSLGMEGSPTIFMHYMFIADSGGVVQCIDLMTFQPVWARDCTDDTDACTVLDWEEETQTMALYVGSQTDYQGFAYIRKLDAENGNLLWEHSYPCYTDTAVSGGVLATPITGRGDMSNLVIFWVGKVQGMGGGGVLVAFDKSTGDVVWENVMRTYGWSSPVGIYTEDGRGYVVVCDAAGEMFLVRGTTGALLDSISLRSNVEASPAVYNNMIVVGTRGQVIYGIKVT